MEIIKQRINMKSESWNSINSMNKKAQQLNFRSFIISFLLIGLFLFAMINIGHQLSVQSGANQSILDDAKLNNTFTEIGNDLNTAKNTGELQKNATESEVIDQPEGAFVLVTIVSNSLKFIGTVVGIYNIMVDFIATRLGIHSVVINTLTAILLITIGLLFWRTFKSGD